MKYEISEFALLLFKRITNIFRELKINKTVEKGVFPERSIFPLKKNHNKRLLGCWCIERLKSWNS